MIGLLIAAIVMVVLAMGLLYRIFKGPTAADRVAALDTLDLVIALALSLYSLYTGRGIYLDIALVVALLGFISTVFAGRYIERRL